MVKYQKENDQNIESIQNNIIEIKIVEATDGNFAV